tara:strand:+ start:1407 stop:2048 length:642 start_codon:yes stop_codon:yes gene_type:complete
MSKFLSSIENSVRDDVPWEYHLIANALTDKQIHEIKNAEISRDGVLHDGTRSGYKEGVEKQNHQLREYITRDNYYKYPELKKLIDEMRTVRVRECIAQMVGNKNSFEGSFVRLEILRDTKSFWLKPHCDIPEKLISSLIYINDTDEYKSLGTDLYDEDLNHVRTIPFLHNLGYIFSGPNKWHGVEPNKIIKVDRRGIQLNYVTFQTDWPVYEV